MITKQVEKLLTTAWFARKDGTADEQSQKICDMIDHTLEALKEIDLFLGASYYPVIKTIYFTYRHKTLREKEQLLPLAPRNIYEYRKKYIAYAMKKLT